MNPDHSQLRHQQQEQSISAQQTQTAAGAKTFETVEEMLRYDSDQNPVPPSVAEKLNQSLATEPKPESSWWKKLFK